MAKSDKNSKSIYYVSTNSNSEKGALKVDYDDNISYDDNDNGNDNNHYNVHDNDDDDDDDCNDNDYDNGNDNQFRKHMLNLRNWSEGLGWWKDISLAIFCVYIYLNIQLFIFKWIYIVTFQIYIYILNQKFAQQAHYKIN